MPTEMSNTFKDPNEVSATAAPKPRKRSKWDQPAEPFASVKVPLPINGTGGISIPGLITSINGTVGIPIPELVPAINSTPINPAPVNSTLPQSTCPRAFSSFDISPSQPKVQDEVIAREIVINDAEPSVRCKLTKRQTQEEIEKSSGAIVITRGKYRPPNSLPDGEKPLYLHISASSLLKDVIERIKAVDKAASIVEDMLKQGKVTEPFTTCVFLGFEADLSLNVSSRIRGPNDQFINHIINETGASVVLRGQGSGNISSDAEESPQPLHLFLSSATAKCLESARILAENLLDTIAAECGAIRIHSSAKFNVVPPTPLPSSTLAVPVPVPIPGMPGVPPASVPVLPPHQIYFPPVSTPVPPPTGLPYLPNPAPTSGTHYDGYYEGIYPQATPLQQVALALKQASPALNPATASAPVAVAPASSIACSTTSVSSSSGVKTNKRAMQKRKFQELPVSVSKGSNEDHQNLQQRSEFYKPGLEESSSNSKMGNLSMIPPPRKLIDLPTDEMAPHRSSAMMPPPPPPPKFTMPPPPPKFSSTKPPPAFESSEMSLSKSDKPLSPPTKPSVKILQEETASETLLKLVEYGEEDDDDEADQADISVKSKPTLTSGPKPF